MMSKITKFLNQPYPYDFNTRTILKHASAVGVFIFLFLFIFQPFEIHPDVVSMSQKISVSLGYGLISFIIPLLFYILLPKLFPIIIAEEQIKIKYELLLSTALLVFIGLGNAFYHHLLYPANNFLTDILQFQYFTFVIGIFPTTLSMMINIILNLRKNLHEARAMNAHINDPARVPRNEQSAELVFMSENEREVLSIPAREFYYIKAAGNYVEICRNRDKGITTEIMRSPIKRLETQLEQHPFIIRCHRAFIINLDHMESVSGDSQGYQVRLKNITAPIPVSRGYIKALKNALTLN